MYKPNSAAEVEDLIYAVQSRLELLEKQATEAHNKSVVDLEDDTKSEILRLTIIKGKLELHQADHDYIDDRWATYGDICTD